ncbi:DUF3631 domain-containing protein [Rhodococcus marinonascens]|uniref:DUF3631 domain-containing protein n=1 Tax=Rhodococcus marinonascens TaxID=38311 RepID=UPI000933975D|nr:DUF3631 domain-containing protein [Rhodococcus marinonascens]
MTPLDTAEAFYRRYAVFPTTHHYAALALWVAHTYATTAFFTTPRLFLDSAVPASGKTRTLELIELTAFNPLLAFSASSASIMRIIDASDPPRTVMFDEIDTLFGQGTSSQAQEITAVINAGYKRGAVVPRCVGDGGNISVVELKAFGPVALAGLHSNVPEATRSRSIHFRMQKRKPSEKLEPFYRRDAEALIAPVTEEFASWLTPHLDSLAHARPQMPKGVEDRPAEIWEPLLAIADLAGGEWPRRAREACRHFVFSDTGYSKPVGLELLSDIRSVFGEQDRMSSGDLVTALLGLPDADWRVYKGGFLTQSTLSRLLRPFDVRSKTIRTAGGTAKGYSVAGDFGLGEAWDRHLRPDDGECEPPAYSEPVTPGTSVTRQVGVGEAVTASVTPPRTVTPVATLTVAENMPSSGSVTPVTPVTAPEDAEKISPVQQLLDEQYPSASSIA